MQMSDRGYSGAGDRDTRSDGGRQSATPAASKLVFECQAEFARHLLCCMFKTGVMADVEVVIDDCCSLRCHTEVLVRVSGYFKTLLQGDPTRLGAVLGFLPRDASAERGNATVSRPSVCLSVCPSVCL